jgi:hypothetical protein
MAAITYSADEKAALQSGRCSLIGLVRIATPVPVRLWTGTGDFPILDSAFDVDGDAFKGGARLISMPAFQTMFNGLAERIVVTLSGVTQEMRDLAATEAADIRGAIFRLGIALLDENFAQLGSARWLRRGRIDVISSNSQSQDNGERVRTLEFSIGSLMTGRKVPGSGVYTHADQTSRPGSEDDRGLERMTLMANATMRWPS